MFVFFNIDKDVVFHIMNQKVEENLYIRAIS